MARPGLRNHLKFKKLVKALNMPPVYVQAHLQSMWDCGYEAANDLLGNADDVELAAEWLGEKGAFFKAVLGPVLLLPVSKHRGACSCSFFHYPICCPANQYILFPKLFRGINNAGAIKHNGQYEKAKPS
jgi:hypothetical protein